MVYYEKPAGSKVDWWRNLPSTKHAMLCMVYMQDGEKVIDPFVGQQYATDTPLSLQWLAGEIAGFGYIPKCDWLEIILICEPSPLMVQYYQESGQCYNGMGNIDWLRCYTERMALHDKFTALAVAAGDWLLLEYLNDNARWYRHVYWQSHADYMKACSKWNVTHPCYDPDVSHAYSFAVTRGNGWPVRPYSETK